MIDRPARAERGEHVFGGTIAAVTVTDPKGRTTTTRFTPRGNAAAATDEQGQPAVYKRDSVGRLSETRDVLGRTMQYTFDNRGNLTQTIDSLGRITNMQYDTQWNKPTTITRYLNNGSGNANGGTPITSTNTFDPANGNLLTTTDALGNISRFTYNPKGQVTTSTNPLGHITRFDYNSAGDLIKVTDPLLNEIAMEPDLAGRTVKLTDPLQYITRIERNNLDQTTKIIDANLGETTMAYNPKHQLASVTDPLNQIVERYSYDDLYRPTQRTDGSQIERRYDAVGRLVKLIRSGGTGSNNQTIVPDETFAYTLDNADRLTQLTRVAGSGAGSRTDTLTYQYDTLNRVTSRTANGVPTTYTYDNAGRIQTITHQAQTTSYTWDAASRLTQKTLPNGILQQMLYDNASRLTSLIYKASNNQIIEQLDYQYDARGQRTGMTSLGSYPVARDTPITATYNVANRLTTLTLKGAGANNTDETYNLSYDDNGNLVEKRGQGAAASKTTTFSWDKQNQLNGMTQAGTDNPSTGSGQAITASFSYDQFGRRVNKNITTNGQSNNVNYVYDGDQAVGEQANGTTTSQLTGIAIDEHIARYSGQDQLIYLTDALGSIIAQTKPDGTLQNKYGYSPYGQVAKDGDDKGNPHQYTGRENDNTGLLFYRARYYMPSCGRFISEDPIGTAGGLNVYGYVHGDPISLVDPTGNCSGSFWDAVKESKNNTDKSINDFLAEAIAFDFDSIKAPTVINAALGGFATKSFGGRTAVQELLRLNQAGKSQPFKLFVKEGSLKLFQLRTVLKTALVSGVATNIAYEGGLYIGSTLSEGFNRIAYCQ